MIFIYSFVSDAGSNFDSNGNIISAKSTSFDFSPKRGQKLSRVTHFYPNDKYREINRSIFSHK